MSKSAREILESVVVRGRIATDLEDEVIGIALSELRDMVKEMKIPIRYTGDCEIAQTPEEFICNQTLNNVIRLLK